MGDSRRLQVVIAGGGIAGLTAALALARRGHAVTQLDRDATRRPSNVRDAVEWERPGVAQFRQPHAFLARMFVELLGELPDVVEGLRAAGGVEVALLDGLQSTWCRRSTFEWVLRRMVEQQHGVVFRHAAVREVETRGGVVSGVRADGAGLLPADLVLNCGGRRSRLAAELTDTEMIDEPTEEVYHSRCYRLRRGQRFGPVNRGVIAVGENEGYAILVFPHDNDIFTVTFTRLPADKALAELRTVCAFEAAAQVVPLAAEWTNPERAEPISDVMVMSGQRNTFRRAGPGAPLGLHSIGDAVSTTNPHFGRGSSLAVAHALRLARAVDQDPTDPRTWREMVDAWVEDELWSWFEDGRRLDRARAAAWREVVSGGSTSAASGQPDSTVDPASLPRLLLLAAASEDPSIGRAVARHMHMVDRPTQLAAMEPRVSHLLAKGWRPVPPPNAPVRAELVDALAAVSVTGRVPVGALGAAASASS